MKKCAVTLLILTSATIASAQKVNHCTDALPKEGAVYNRLRASSYTDLHYLLDEYIYQMNFSTMDDALHAGLNVGTVVYGVPLQIGGKFDEDKKQQWRSEYESRRKVQFAQTTLSTLEIDKLDPNVISVIASACMDFGLFSAYRPTDECHFTFRAGYRSDKASGDRITPASLTVKGGTCTDWPHVPLSPSGNEIACTRSGKGATTVILATNQVGDATQTLPPLDPPAIPSEPQMVDKMSDPIVQTIDVNGWEATHIGGNRGCPDCKDLFAQNFGPNLAAYPDNLGAVITDVSADSRSGTCSHWIRCPDGGNCGNGFPLFSGSSGYTSSCIGSSGCTMYHITNGSTACTEHVRVTFTYKKRECEGCNGKPFADALAAWQQARKEADDHSCPTVSDKNQTLMNR